MSTASWICPSCERRVPPRVDVCRCGVHRADDQDASVATPDDAPARSSGASAAGWVAPIVFALALGAWTWLRPTPPAPVPMPPSEAPADTAQRSAHEPPVALDASSVPATSSTPTADTPVARTAASADPPTASVSVVPRSGPAALEDVVASTLGAVVMIEASDGRGTGFYVGPDLVVSNAHVVGRDLSVTLRLHDGSSRQARVERTVPDVDLALLRAAMGPPSAAPIAALTLGTAHGTRVGQEVIAIGSALGLQSTVTRGILSAKRQSGPVTLLQTDAAINPGNSGGPLLDRDGTVIGVTTLKMGGRAEGLGFAVSVDHVRALVEGRSPSAAPTTASSVPMPPPSQAGPPVGTQPSANADQQRAANLAALERELRNLASQATQVDAQWARFERTCRPQASRDGDRPWFALATARATFDSADRNCPYWLGDLESNSRAFGDVMRSLGEEARRAGVYPGDLRTLRRQYRLDWSGFDR
jgi:S1-C subfamily serine protease